MKIRTGFVTNSSSSSFIVMFDRIPQSADEVHNILFKTEHLIELYDHTMSSRHVAERVWDDIQRQKPNDHEHMLDHLDSRFPGCPDYDDFMTPSGKTDLAAYNRVMSARRDRFIASISDPDKYIFCFKYADEDGEVVLEHGDIFRNLEHHTINHH